MVKRFMGIMLVFCVAGFFATTGPARAKWYTNESLHHHKKRETQTFDHEKSNKPSKKESAGSSRHDKIEPYVRTREGLLFKGVNIPYIGKDKVYVGHWRFRLSRDLKVLDAMGNDMGVDSLLGVGFVTRADVVVKNRKVVKIVVIDMEQ